MCCVFCTFHSWSLFELHACPTTSIINYWTCYGAKNYVWTIEPMVFFEIAAYSLWYWIGSVTSLHSLIFIVHFSGVSLLMQFTGNLEMNGWVRLFVKIIFILSLIFTPFFWFLGVIGGRNGRMVYVSCYLQQGNQIWSKVYISRM